MGLNPVTPFIAYPLVLVPLNSLCGQRGNQYSWAFYFSHRSAVSLIALRSQQV